MNFASFHVAQLQLTVLFQEIQPIIKFFIDDKILPLIDWHLVYIFVDTVTGLVAALIRHEWSWKNFIKGFFRKFRFYPCLALSRGLDVALNSLTGNYVVQGILMFSLLISEFLSIIKNLYKIGLGSCVPPGLSYILRRLNRFVVHPTAEKNIKKSHTVHGHTIKSDNKSNSTEK